MTTIIEGLSPAAKVVTPSSPNYQQAVSRPSATSILPAAYVVYPSIVQDIPLALGFARKHNPPLEIAVKGGGCHTSTASSSNGGITIDLSLMKHVTVSEDKKTVAVGGGALWGDVYSELANHNLVVVGGGVWSVGVGGYLTGGGYSNLSGMYGLAIDNLVATTIVLADGSVKRCDPNTEPDLFWAVRGT
jgi:FAD/FMN-containing dehydrogenase